MIVPITISVLVAVLLSICLNRLLIRYALPLGLMDVPDARRVHSTPIPRAGGIAVWLTFIVTVYGLAAIRPEIFKGFHHDWLTPFTAASAILVTVGVIDDRTGVKAWWKLGGQILAAGVFYAMLPVSGGKLFGLAIPTWMNALVFIGWAVLLINAFNLIDGLDGLCGGLALIALVSLGAISAINGHVGAMVVLFLMAGALVGFLHYNRNPARIFLGDTGSMILGFFIAAAATPSSGHRAIVGVILLPIAVAGVPLLDVLLAIWRRSMRKLINQWSDQKRIGIFEPDKDHLHHRLLATGAGQKKVTRILHGLALILSVLAFLPMIFGEKVFGISLVGLMVLVLAGLRHFASIELVNSGSMLHLALKRPNDNRFYRMAVFTFDCFALLISGGLAVWLETNRRDFEWLTGFQFIVTFAILGILSLLFVRAYRRSWSRATIRDLIGVQVAIASAGALCVSVFTVFQQEMAFSTLTMGMLATFFATVLIQIPKCSIEIMRELAVDAGHRRTAQPDTDGQRVVIYGAGDLGNLFVEYLKTCSAPRFSAFRVLGFLDDKPSLHGRIIRGFPVMGNLGDLEDIDGRKGLHGIIVAISHLNAEKIQEVREAAERNQLKIYSWCFDLSPLEVGLDDPLPEAQLTPLARRRAPLLGRFS